MNVALARSPLSVAELVDRLVAVPGREGRLTHLELVPPRAATTAVWPAWAAPDVVAAYAARGVREPWRHQAVAADAATSLSAATGVAVAALLADLAITLRRKGRTSAAAGPKA